ncbi:hypothetical protein TNCV_3932151 [Trichonephila clavipes]|nr:hypothetical protein TNCV_3932151 [Trichonephila clavipes]
MCWSVWCDNINSRADRRIAKNITSGISSPWVPTRVFCIEISKEKGSIMGENSIEFRNIGSPLLTALSCLLSAISKVWDLIFFIAKYDWSFRCSRIVLGNTQSFPFSKRPSREVLTQCTEQPGGVLACIDNDGSDFLFASDDSKIIALRVGEVTDAIGNNYPRALCVDRAGYLRGSGFRAALVIRAIVLHRRDGFPLQRR